MHPHQDVHSDRTATHDDVAVDEVVVAESLREIPTESINKIRICCTNRDDVVRVTLSHLLAKLKPIAIRLVNSYSLALAQKDAEFQALLGSEGVNFPDGLPLAKYLRFLHGGDKRIGQVRGPSLFAALLDHGSNVGLRHFLLGGSEISLVELRSAISTRFPGALIVGAVAPPFRALSQEELAAQDEKIRNAQPDIVWVGLGTPKQDFVVQRIVTELGITAVGIGAAFDFLAGTQPTAPRWMRKVGLEWLFRLLSEPQRLWKRYFFGNARFLTIIANDFRNRKNPDPISDQ